MTLVSWLLLVVVVFVAAVLVLATTRRSGDGADLLDWDPSERIRRRRDADLEELELGMAEHNRRRVEAGLHPQSELELRRVLARNRRKGLR